MGYPPWKTFDELVASDQAFWEGVPRGAVSPAGSQPRTAEAATNAVNACRTSGCSAPVTLYAEWGPYGTLRVLVSDDAPGIPAQRGLARDTADAESGRGLLIIGGSDTDWGVCQHGPGPGKAVWFQVSGPELPRPGR